MKKMKDAKALALYTQSSLKDKKGITLIALVITIIVLLILAGVSLQAIMGDNGVVTKASNAKENTAIGREIEQINLSYADCKADNALVSMGDTLVSASQLEDAMNKTYGAGTVVVTEFESKLIVEYLSSGRSYGINREKGKVEATLNWNKIFETAAKHPEQTESGNIGIAEDGSAVNLDLWEWCKYNNGTEICLSSQYSSWTYAGYVGEYIDGKIIGKVPMYILDVDGSYTEYLPVTSMRCTFYECWDLKEAPEIPSTVRDLDRTFYDCRELRTAPVIPENVTNMNETFYMNVNLTGTLTIHANPTTYNNCLSYASATDLDWPTSLVLNGRSRMLQEILATAGEKDNMTIE